MKRKQQYEQFRRKYPQKLQNQQVKGSILYEWIEKFHILDFQNIYKKQCISSTKGNLSNQKVVDQNYDIGEISKINEMKLKNQTMQAVKIIVKAYEKNQQIRQKYTYENVEQMIEKAKITLKQLLKMTPTQSIKPINDRQIKQNINNVKPQQKLTNVVVKNQIDNKILNPNVQKKPKSNSLFVQKQAPISEQNIFKDQEREIINPNRPNSRLLNEKIQNIVPEKPTSRSSAKSNKSKRSRISSHGLQNAVINEVDKKGQNFTQSDKKQTFSMKVIEKNQNNVKAQIVQNQQLPPTLSQQQQINESSKQIIQSERKGQEQQQYKQKQIKKIVFDSNNNSLHLPSFQLSTERPIRKKDPIQSILTNPYIKKTFSHLCKQSYIGGGKTFDQIAQSSDIMNLNKWMVFCKEFDFVSKLKKKQLVDIFQQCTQNKPHMNQQQFLDGLIIVQSKLRVDEQDFIRKKMCLDSEFAFRQKVATFKVSYAGSKHNFFEQASVKPVDKYYKNLRQVAYQKEKMKQRQIILSEGKFRQQIESELLDRKNQRNLRKINQNNFSMIEKIQNRSRIVGSISMQRKNQQRVSVKSPYLNHVEKITNINRNSTVFNHQNDAGLSKLNISRRVDPLTYADLFSQKSSIAARAFTTDIKSSPLDSFSLQKQTNKIKSQISNSHNSQRAITQISQSKPQTSKVVQKISQKSSSQAPDGKYDKAQEKKPQRQWIEQIKNWAQQFQKSQSDQSDDILRQHLMSQKVKKSHIPEKMHLSRMMQQYKNDQKWLEPNDKLDNHSQWDRETQLQTTIHKQRFK